MNISIDTYERIYDNLIIDDETGCWNYHGTDNGKGYQLIYADGRQQAAHRLMYQLHFGEIPKNKEIHHVCGNRACICPDHLQAVSHRLNVALTETYTKRRWERLQLLLGAHLDLAFFGVTQVTSTALKRIWGQGCRTGNIPDYLTTVAFVFDGDFEWTLVEKRRGRKPNVFEIRMSRKLRQQLETDQDEPTQTLTNAQPAIMSLPSVV